MKSKPRFREDVLDLLEKSKVLRVRAGKEDHRFIGIWFVIVGGRVLVRSWSIKPYGWYRTFLFEPLGTIQFKKSELQVQAVPMRSKRLLEAVDRAYLSKYKTPGALKYAKDLCQTKSRATTHRTCSYPLEPVHTVPWGLSPHRVDSALHLFYIQKLTR